MDSEKFVEKFGGRIVFHGGIDVQRFFQGDPYRGLRRPLAEVG
jgi:hypothetical protein